MAVVVDVAFEGRRRGVGELPRPRAGDAEQRHHHPDGLRGLLLLHVAQREGPRLPELPPHLPQKGAVLWPFFSFFVWFFFPFNVKESVGSLFLVMNKDEVVFVVSFT